MEDRGASAATSMEDQRMQDADGFVDHGGYQGQQMVTNEASGDPASYASVVHETEAVGDRDSTETHEPGILDIPVQAFLHILQYLDARDVCSLGATCRQCDSFCRDRLLWRAILNKDMVKWTEVSSGTYPTNLTAAARAEGDVDYKDVYMKCNPELQQEEGFQLSSIPRLLWSFLPRRTPIVVMFGPGLETDTSSVVRKLITGSDIVRVNGVFPAMYPGVGTGFEVTIKDKTRLRLVVLYSATRKEREERGRSNEPRMSKLIKRMSTLQDAGSGTAAADRADDRSDGAEGAALPPPSDEDFLNFEPTDHVKAMCRVVGGFIFVVDAAQQLPRDNCSSGRPELFAFVNSRWTPEKKPLLVLSSVASADIPRVPCVKVADQLSLQRLERPWKVVNCDISSLDGLSEGVDWLVNAAQRV